MFPTPFSKQISRTLEVIGFAGGILAATTGVLTTKPEAKDPRATLLFLDFESPHEADTWIDVLGLKEEGCPKGVHLCNREFLAYRPIADPELRADWIGWAEREGILPDAVFISGHHAGGFWGILGRFYLSDVRPLLERPFVHKFLTSPSFVYLGGCYTVQSRFPELEGSPVEYLNRVLSHDERPSSELLISAIHQIGIQGVANPWAPVFPNAALFGFGASAPGSKSADNSDHLVRGFGSRLKEVTHEGRVSKALLKVLTSAKASRAGSDLFKGLSNWWNSEGQLNSRTSASSICRSGGERCSKVVFDLPIEDEGTADVVARFASQILMPSEDSPWVLGLPVEERATLLRYTHRTLARIPASFGATLHLCTAAVSTFSNHAPTRMREEAVRILRVIGRDSPGTVPFLENQGMFDESPAVRSLAALELYRSGRRSEEIAAAVEEGLGHREPDIRSEALHALSELEISGVTEARIARHIADSDRNVGLNAAAIIFSRRDRLDSLSKVVLDSLAEKGNGWASKILKGEDPAPEFGGGSPILAIKVGG